MLRVTIRTRSSRLRVWAQGVLVWLAVRAIFVSEAAPSLLPAHVSQVQALKRLAYCPAMLSTAPAWIAVKHRSAREKLQPQSHARALKAPFRTG